MEVEADPNLLVVNLEHCVSETRQFGKSSCIYSAAMPPNSCGHDVLQLATPVQCIGNLSQPMSRIQHQHLTQLQPIQYPQVQVSYDNGTLQQSTASLLTGGAPLYQAPPPTTIHHYHPPSHQAYHSGYLTPLQVAQPQPIQDYPSLISTPLQQIQQDPISTQPQQPATPTVVSPLVNNNNNNINDTFGPSSEGLGKKDALEPEPPPSDDYQYYKEIEQFLVAREIPPNASQLYSKRLKKRAQNYLVVDGVLHHNPKEPRRVVMTKEEQAMLLTSHHITANTGVHIGIKKMFAKLRAEYFWRGMYVCVATYVRKCTKCRDSGPDQLPQLITSQKRSDGDSTRVSAGVQTASKIWCDVEIQLCGPYNTTNTRNSYIAVVVDADSKFLIAAALPASGLATRLTQFVLSTLFSFGFARTYLVTKPELYSAVHDEFTRRTRDLRDCHGLLRLRDHPVCEWVRSLLALLVEKKPNRWDKELDKFLYQFRSGEMKQSARICAKDESCIGTVCPFYSMFQRSPCPISAVSSAEDKENSFLTNNRTIRLRNKKQDVSTGDHVGKQKCSDDKNNTSLSKLSAKETKDHPKNCSPHDRDPEVSTREARKTLETIADLRQIAVKTTGFNSPAAEPVENAVSSIKAFLAETRVARQRRGNYNKYPDELPERMASYALKHGSQEAAKHFSAVLGTQVNDSTIRNLVKSRARFGLALRQEIAKFAVENGVSEAAKHYSATLNMAISHYLIRRFKSLYGPKRSQCKKAKNKMKKDVESLTVKVKYDIGRFASENSIEKTIEHFRSLLGIHLLESAVEQLHQAYLQKHQPALPEVLPLTPEPPSQRADEQQPSNVSKESLVGQKPGNSNLCFTQPNNNVVTENGYSSTLQVYQPQFPAGTCPGRPPESVVVKQESLIGYSKPANSNLCLTQPNSNVVTQNGYYGNLQMYQPQFPPSTCSGTPSETVVDSGTGNAIVSQHFLLISPENNSSYELEVQARFDGKTNWVNGANQGTATGEYPSYQQVDNPIFVEVIPEKTNQDNQKLQPSSEVNQPQLVEQKPASTVKKKVSVKKRGKYSTFSPELRADIGKYAVEHGCLKASNHFSSVLGRDLSESTIRGIKEKYLCKLKYTEVTSLGYSPRGRAPRLGKYDEMVQNCLQELIKTGERASSFLAIITARKILSKYEPNLLKENGGNIELNNSWAKSFLKRLGLRNNS